MYQISLRHKSQAQKKKKKKQGIVSNLVGGFCSAEASRQTKTQHSTLFRG